MLEHYTAMVPNPLSGVTEVAMGTAIQAGRPVTFSQAVNNNVGEGTISVKQEASLLGGVGVCGSCGRSIADRFLLRVNERYYHENCLSCTVCLTPLSRICYTRDCKFYCREDYERTYGTKCGRCQQKLDSTDLVMRVQTRTVNGRPDGPIFHVECFVCYVCNEQLNRGAHFILRHGQPLCKREFQNDMYNMNSPQVAANDTGGLDQNCSMTMTSFDPEKLQTRRDCYQETNKSKKQKRYPIHLLFYLKSSDDDLLDDSRPRDGRRGPKRPRTILTSVQRRQFKASFEVSPKPCRKVREALAKDTGLSVRVVQVWFQNQRAKMKKLQRKAKTDTGADKEIKEERKPESPHSDHSHYMNALNMRDGESSNFPSATQPLNPNNPYSPDDAYPGHSGESFCSSDISIDGTEAGFELGESESGAGADGSHQGTATSSHPHHTGGSSISSEIQSLSQSCHSAVHNPIDKLFMMQTSYFSSADHP